MQVILILMLSCYLIKTVLLTLFDENKTTQRWCLFTDRWTDRQIVVKFYKLYYKFPFMVLQS